MHSFTGYAKNREQYVTNFSRWQIYKYSCFNDMVVSPFAISTSQTITSSAKNYTTPHPITPILDFKTGFVFLEKEKDNSLEKSNCCSVKTYIDSVSVKAK